MNSLLPIALWTTLLAGQSAAQSTFPVRIEKLFETGDPMPGYPDTFNAIGLGASLHSGEAAFSSFGGSTQTTVLYKVRTDGSLAATPIVDSTMQFPNSSALFRGMSVPLIRDGLAVFTARSVTANPWGIYAGDGGPVQTLIDRDDGWAGFQLHGFDGAHIAFYGAQTYAALWVMDVNGGPVVEVATGQDPIPGSPDGLILSLQDIHLNEGQLVFSVRAQNTITFNTFYAILRYDIALGQLETLVDEPTPIPGSTETFTLVTHPTVDDGAVLFQGSLGNPNFGGTAGLYRWKDGTLTTLVDTTTERPDGSGTFAGFQGTFVGWRAQGAETIFTATDFAGEPMGIYGQRFGELFEIIEVGDTIDGRTVEDLSFFDECYDGRQVVFHADLTDGVSGLYVAQLPRLRRASSPAPSSRSR